MATAAGPLEATINYAPASLDAEGMPEIQARAPRTAGEARRARTGIDRHGFDIVDARSLDRPASLDTEGVELHRLATAATDLYDDAQVRGIYFPEVIRLVAEVTGAARVEAFDYNLRNATRAERGDPGVQSPVKYAHNDYTVKSGPRRVRDLFPDEAETLLAKRVAVINVWKPISGPVIDTPLAVCDAASIGDGQLIATNLAYTERTGEIYSLGFSEGHRWLYYPQMRADEAMLLKCYDSETDGRARFTAHSAFRDPGAPEDAPARESIEVRTLAFFD